MAEKEAQKVRKYDFVLADLDPVKGSEQRGTRPCVVVQNNNANVSRLQTVTVIICTSVLKKTPDGLFVRASKENGLTEDSRIEVSQLRTIDRTRILKKYGVLEFIYREDLRHKLFDFFDLYDVLA